MNSILICAVFISMLGHFGSSALRIDIDPQNFTATRQKSVHISCRLDEDYEKNKDITVMEITKDSQALVVLRECSNVTIPEGIERQIEATGMINDETKQSYINMTLLNPRSSDSDDYYCKVSYIDRFGQQSDDYVSAYLTVNVLDTNQLESVIYDLTSKIAVLEAPGQKAPCKPCDDDFVSAFLVSNDERLPITKGSTVVFPVVVMKRGDGYDVSTGIYTAPRSGLYVFHLAAGTTTINCYLYLKLWANDVMFAQLGSLGHKTYDRSSISAPIELKAGDKVKVVADNNNCGAIEKFRESLFGGYCVKDYGHQKLPTKESSDVFSSWFNDY